MAFDRTNFALDSAGNNPNVPRRWTYTTTDATTDVDTAGYFNDASDLVSIGDLIYAITSSGGTPSYDSYHVSANAAGVVDVNNSAPTDGATDSD
jgi:hypothetical protein